jgi:serine/threonine protein phosphatase PrpC
MLDGVLKNGIKLEAPCMFMMTTDGFYNSFIDDEQYRISCEDYYKTICKYGNEQVQKNLANWLEQTSEEGCGDDITLVAVGFVEEDISVNEDKEVL